MPLSTAAIQKSVSNLGCATGKVFYNGIAEVSQVAAAYGPIVADQTVKLSGHTAKLARENKALSVCVAGGIIIAAPSLVSAPVLQGLGYTITGVKAGSLATGIQSAIGNVGTGSLFATAQSAGAGGAGLVALNTAIQSAGAAIMSSSGMMYLRSKL
ncbi:uncharacterized protein TRUGW13939_02537 [Talaromyces rugulosus]|uniref:Uncharacterized protein n=1 Tax=Talaromyces rugulosus TaxID=121627 RepID=A0A7H8QND8_TALRU|nr:uncharacterized protein TRUGW13939_02537 [Talaromyces rugulosus]QKX55444.1 hypothetical protein TRUGW13939_02537 [Talaromyces rugulosus]